MGGRPDPRPTENDLERYLAARAEAAAQQAADVDMVERVAIGVGLVQRRRQRRAFVRVGLAAAALVALLAVGFGSGVLRLPDASPLPVPTDSQRPSPAALQALADVPYPGVAIAASEDAVWVADGTGELAELDPNSGAVIRRVDLPRPADALLMTADSIWASSSAGDLLRVDRVTLAVTPVVGAVGVALSAGVEAIWLGGTDEVIRIDLATGQVDLRVPVPGRSPDLGVVAVADTVWIASRSAIVRVDADSGATTASIPGDASRLAFAAGRLWAIRGFELLEIDVEAIAIVGTTPGLPGTGTIAVAFEHVWVAGPEGGGPAGSVVGVSTSTGELDRSSSFQASVGDLAAGAGGVWVAEDTDGETRVIRRFAAP